jgi:hypothetical protein
LELGHLLLDFLVYVIVWSREDETIDPALR